MKRIILILMIISSKSFAEFGILGKCFRVKTCVGYCHQIQVVDVNNNNIIYQKTGRINKKIQSSEFSSIFIDVFKEEICLDNKAHFNNLD